MTTLLLPRLRHDQWVIAAHEATVKVIAMGRRWGKSTMAGAVSLATASQGATVAWVVPTYKNGRPLWRWTERAVAPLRRERAVEVNRSERTVSFPSGGFLGIYSADNPTSILGEAFDLVVIDEAARIDEQVWVETLQPTLADRSGRALLISTPKGRNWFWKEYIRAKSDGKRAAAFNAPSSANPNPNIQRAAEYARGAIPDRTYRQEWLAEFVDMEGAVFIGLETVPSCALLDEPLPQHSYTFGIDWASGSGGDSTVVAVMDMESRGCVHIWSSNVTAPSQSLAAVRALYERWRPLSIIAEKNSLGLPLVEQMQRSGLPVQPFLTTNATKSNLVNALQLAIEQRTIALPEHEELNHELVAYEQYPLPGGGMRYSAPQGMHDDHVMALMLALHGCHKPDFFVWGVA